MGEVEIGAGNGLMPRGRRITQERQPPANERGKLPDMQLHRRKRVEQRGKKRPANAGIVPWIRQAWVQHTAIGKTRALRGRRGRIDKLHLMAARRELVKTRYARQAAADNDDRFVAHPPLSL